MLPESASLLQWTGIINAADYFLGCDSVGQHIAHSLNKPGAVVMGSTFPENTSHPADSSITIIDNGKGERIYSPIRIVVDVRIDRHNENLMKLTTDTMTQIIEGVNNSLPVTQDFTMITEEK
jgi:ADP-heptose:LPS heptosyltransferase